MEEPWEVIYNGLHLTSVTTNTIRIPREFDQAEADRLIALGYGVEPYSAEVHVCGDECEVSHMRLIKTFVEITKPS